MAEIVGIEGLQDADRLLMKTAERIRNEFLCQNAYSDDAFSPPEKTLALIKAILGSMTGPRTRLKEGALHGRSAAGVIAENDRILSMSTLLEHIYRTISTIAGPLLFVERVRPRGSARWCASPSRRRDDGRGDAEDRRRDRAGRGLRGHPRPGHRPRRWSFTDAIKKVPLSPDIIGRVFNGSFVPKDDAPLFIPENGCRSPGLP